VSQLSDFSRVFDPRRDEALSAERIPPTSQFNEPLDKWQVGKATTLQGMFAGSSSFSHSLNSWNTSNVIDMSFFLLDATSWNGDISTFDTSNVKYMRAMVRTEVSDQVSTLTSKHLTMDFFDTSSGSSVVVLT
jgi:Mycoplasma protein of unknown function, DUF285